MSTLLLEVSSKSVSTFSTSVNEQVISDDAQELRRRITSYFREQLKKGRNIRKTRVEGAALVLSLRCLSFEFRPLLNLLAEVTSLETV